MRAAASFLLRPESKMLSALSDTGDMAGFIHVQTKLIQFMDTEDEQLKDLTAEEIGYTDILVNVNEIMYVFDDGHNTIIKMSNGNELQVKESIHEVHQRIKRTTAFFLGQ
jgi:DNA-binding LytR/AlgR family response regulator